MALTALAAVGLTACTSASDPEAGQVVAQPVVLQTLEQADRYTITREFAGLVAPAQATDLGFELAGKLAALKVDEGDLVKAGEVLARLDVQLLKDQRLELQGRAKEITAGIALNRLNTKRIDELESRGFASRQRADELATEFETLTAQQLQVSAALATNQTRIDKSVLLAPFDSTISSRFVDQGAVVDAGTPVLRLLESGNAEARVGIPVRLRDTVTLGQDVTLTVAGQPAVGRVIAVSQNVTRATLTVPVRIALTPDTPAVYGDQAYLNLQETVDNPGFWVPLEALTEGMRGLWNVYVARPEGPTMNQGMNQGMEENLIVESRDVRILHADRQRAFVVGALEADEWLVASGLHRLVPGQRVTRAAAPLADQSRSLQPAGVDG